MSSDSDILKCLQEPFSKNDIEWRVGSRTKDRKKGRALPYITARAVMARLDEVVGVGGWKDQYEVIPHQEKPAVICRLSLLIDGQWVTKEDGSQVEFRNDSDIDPWKTAFSDALKRVAVKWGIGRYLYAYEAPWVELENERQLARIPELPDWALPEAERRGSSGKPPRADRSIASTAAAAPEAPASEAVSAPETPPAPQSSSEDTAGLRNATKYEVVAQPDTDVADLPESLNAEERTIIQQLLSRVAKKTPIRTVFDYVTKPKCQSLFSDEGYRYLYRKLGIKVTA